MGELINGRTPEEIKQGLRRCKTVCLDDCPYYKTGIKCSECTTFLSKDALAYIEHLEAQQPKWISVKERLPEHRQRVYARAKDGFCFESVYIDPVGFERYEIGEGWINENKNVTHWMPLPEPPEED